MGRRQRWSSSISYSISFKRLLERAIVTVYVFIPSEKAVPASATPRCSVGSYGKHPLPTTMPQKWNVLSSPSFLIIRLERRQQTAIPLPCPRNPRESAFPVTQILLQFLKGSHSLSPFWQSTRISSYLCSLSPSLFSESRQRGRQIPTGSFLSSSCTLQETGIGYGAGGGEKRAPIQYTCSKDQHFSW